MERNSTDQNVPKEAGEPRARRFRPFTHESYEKLLISLEKWREQEMMHQQASEALGTAILVNGGVQSLRELLLESGKLLRTQDEALVDGCRWPQEKFGQCPVELLGRPLEEIDPYLKQKTFVVINKRFKSQYISRYSAENAMFLFPPWHPVRKFAILISTNIYYNLFIMLCFIVNSILLALPDHWTITYNLYYLIESIMILIFATELVLRWTARGIIMEKHTALREIYFICGKSTNRSATGFRAVRVFRLLKTFSIIPGLNTVTKALVNSVKMLVDMAILTAFLIITLSIFANLLYGTACSQKCVHHVNWSTFNYSTATHNIFYKNWIQNKTNWKRDNGKWITCSNSSGGGKCSESSEDFLCVAVGQGPNKGFTSFSSFINAVPTIAQLITMDYFENPYNIVIRTNNSLHLIFFILITYCGSYYLMNVMLALVVLKYEEEVSLERKIRRNIEKNHKRQMHRLEKQRQRGFEKRYRFNPYTMRMESLGSSMEMRSRQHEIETLHSHNSGKLKNAISGNKAQIHETTDEENVLYYDYENDNHSQIHVSDPLQVAYSSRRKIGRESGEVIYELLGTWPPALKHSRHREDIEAVYCNYNAAEHTKIVLKKGNLLTDRNWLILSRSGFVSGIYLEVLTVQNVIHGIVCSKVFFSMIMTCICVNIVLMLTLHHPQPDWFTHMQFISDKTFNIIFLIEAIIKLIALSKSYFLNGWNVFDFVLTLISSLDLFVPSNLMDMLNLKVFRILRVMRLSQLWTTMDILMRTLGKSIISLGNLTLVLFFTIFTCALIGNHVLGRNATSLPLSNNFFDPPHKAYDRWNFDNFGQSIMTTFRIICGEWIELLWECKGFFKHDKGRKISCSLVIVPTLIFGNFMVLNLFLALMVDSLGSKELRDNIKVDIKKFLNKFRGVRALKNAEQTVNTIQRTPSSQGSSVASTSSDQDQLSKSNKPRNLRIRKVLSALLKKRKKNCRSHAILTLNDLPFRTNTTQSSDMSDTGSFDDDDFSRSTSPNEVKSMTLSGNTNSKKSVDKDPPTNMNDPQKMRVVKLFTKSDNQFPTATVNATPLHSPRRIFAFPIRRNVTKTGKLPSGLSVDTFESAPKLNNRLVAEPVSKRSSVSLSSSSLAMARHTADVSNVDVTDAQVIRNTSLLHIGMHSTSRNALVAPFVRSLRTVMKPPVEESTHSPESQAPLFEHKPTRVSVDDANSTTNRVTNELRPTLSEHIKNNAIVQKRGLVIPNCCCDSCYDCCNVGHCCESFSWCQCPTDSHLSRMGNAFRKWTNIVVSNEYFDYFILIAIVTSTLTMCFEDHNIRKKPHLLKLIQHLNIFFTLVFIVEVFLRLSAKGFYQYFTDMWCLLDIATTVGNVVDTCLDVMDIDVTVVIGQLRAFRALRLLRAVNNFQQIRIITSSLVNAVPSLVNVILVCLVIWMMFSVMGVELFKGKFYKCADITDGSSRRVNYEYAQNVSMCYKRGLHWVNSEFNFDHVGNAILCLFQIATFEGWMEIMGDAIDSTEIDEQPRKNARIHMYIYFVAFIIVGSFVILNLLLSVIIENFQELKKEYEKNPLHNRLSVAQKQYLRAVKNLGGRRPHGRMVRPKNELQRFLYDVAVSAKLEIGIMVVILCSITLLTFNDFDGPDDIIVYFLSFVCSAVFAMEAMWKIAALGFYYFTRPWNVVDFAIVVIDFLGVFSTGADENRMFYSAIQLTRLVRVLRLKRVLRLIPRAKGLRKLLTVLVQSLYALLNVGALLLIISVVYALLGMSFFVDTPRDDTIDDVMNFDTFEGCMLMLFRLSNAGGWDEVLKSLIAKHRNSTKENGTISRPGLAVAYISSYVFISSRIINNLYIAVMLENFQEAHLDEELGISPEDVEMFYTVWERFDPLATEFIPWNQVTLFLQQLNEPFRITNPTEATIASFELPIVQGDLVHCFDLLKCVIREALPSRVIRNKTFYILEAELEDHYSRLFPVRRYVSVLESSRQRKGKEIAVRILQRCYRYYRASRILNSLRPFTENLPPNIMMDIVEEFFSNAYQDGATNNTALAKGVRRTVSDAE